MITLGQFRDATKHLDDETSILIRWGVSAGYQSNILLITEFEDGATDIILQVKPA